MCSAIAAAAWCKIQREHRIYIDLRQQQVELATRVVKEAGLQQSDLPTGLRTVALPDTAIGTRALLLLSQPLGQSYFASRCGRHCSSLK
jgi:hypothetical protein